MVREPYGVIGIISPWNYPFSIPATESLAALVAGNAVVVKPSEFTSLTAIELASLLHQAGVPKEIFQVVVGDGATGASLINAAIDKLVFTGSVPTGKQIAQAAAARLLRVVLELGGKDPMLVLDDADLEIAAGERSGALSSMPGRPVFRSSVAMCIAVCIRHFSRPVCARPGRLRVGNGMDPEIEIGPLIHQSQLRNVESQVEDARAQGAQVLAGGKRLTGNRGKLLRADNVWRMSPTRCASCAKKRLGRCCRSCRSTATMKRSVWPTIRFGLAASVWTRDRTRGEALARRIQAGTVMVNDVVSCFGISEAPHGGVKASGIGRTHGRFGLDEMVRIKYLDSDRVPNMKKLWWYGYGGNSPDRWRASSTCSFLVA